MTMTLAPVLTFAKKTEDVLVFPCLAQRLINVMLLEFAIPKQASAPIPLQLQAQDATITKTAPPKINVMEKANAKVHSTAPVPSIPVATQFVLMMEREVVER
jgi:hypothetical protein